jgi:hypothetical protein
MVNIAGKKQFGFVINIERNWIFDKNCLTLHLEGYSLIGVEVLHTEIFPGTITVLAPNEEYIGVILEIQDTLAKVTTNDGVREIPLNELSIRKTKFNIVNYLDFALSAERTAEILNFIERKKHELFNTKNIYKDINEIAKALFRNKLTDEPVQFENRDGFVYAVGDTPMAFSNTFLLKMPTFIYDPAGVKTNSNYPDLGLTNFGPYDSTNFDIKSPVALCIGHRENRGTLPISWRGLKDGMPTSRYFIKGLQKKYELQDVNYHVRELTSFDLNEYFRVVREWESEQKPDLAIIEIPAEFKHLKDNDNPYYKLKPNCFHWRSLCNIFPVRS